MNDKSQKRQLTIMRHAKSDWYANYESDFERPLNSRGRKSAIKMGKWLAIQGLLPNKILYSPASRASNTVKLVTQSFEVKDQYSDDRLYATSYKQILNVLSETHQNVRRLMLVGHNPELESLLLWLTNQPELAFDDGKVMPTAAVAVVSFSEDWALLNRGCGQLVHHVRPSMI